MLKLDDEGFIFSVSRHSNTHELVDDVTDGNMCKVIKSLMTLRRSPTHRCLPNNAQKFSTAARARMQRGTSGTVGLAAGIVATP